MRIATPVLLVPLLLLIAAGAYAQTTITVNTLIDNQSSNGDCSLREAILAAETNAPRDACPAGSAAAPDEIVFSVAGTILYQFPLIFITQDVTIIGPGAAALTLDGNAADRLFQVNGGVVSISNLTMTNGNSASGSLMSTSGLATVTLTDCVLSNGTTGEAVRNSGTLTVDNCTFTGNSGALQGGGLHNRGTALVRNSTFTGNSSHNGGGAIFSRQGASLTLENCVITQNSTTLVGGGIMVGILSAIGQGTATITNTTIAGNQAASGGGGIVSYAITTITGSTISGNQSNAGAGGIETHGSLTLTNSTVSGNQSTDTAGGINSRGFGIVQINNSTITGNAVTQLAGTGGIRKEVIGSSLTLYSSLVAGNTSAVGDPDLGGSPTFASNGFNLVGDVGAATFSAVTSDQVGGGGNPVIDPLLDLLANSGGPTETHLPLPGSPTVDAGDCAQAGLTLDQRGAFRPLDLPAAPNTGNGCDVGAVEATAAELPVDLVAFDVVLNGDDALLRWETASETNNAGFEILRMSINEGSDWEALAFVEGHGTTEQAQAYQYRVFGLLPGRHAFRLKQIDFDGAFDYSPVVEVIVALREAFVVTPLFPNPFTTQARFAVAVPTAQHVTVAVYDLLGREVARLHDGPLAPDRMHPFTLARGLEASGLYVVQVRGQRFRTSRAVLFVR